MSWTKDHIRYLRLRYGWSHSDMARRIDCSSDEVMAWEAGSNIPSTQQMRLLDILRTYADSTADEVRELVTAEIELDNRAVGQLQRSDLKDLN